MFHCVHQLVSNCVCPLLVVYSESEPNNKYAIKTCLTNSPVSKDIQFTVI